MEWRGVGSSGKVQAKDNGQAKEKVQAREHDLAKRNEWHEWLEER